VLHTHLPPRVARDLSNRERLDFHPLASHQVYKGPITTERLFVRSTRRLLLQALHLTLIHRQRCLPAR
jgi:hypothetical protein